VVIALLLFTGCSEIPTESNTAKSTTTDTTDSLTENWPDSIPEFSYMKLSITVLNQGALQIYSLNGSLLFEQTIKSNTSLLELPHSTGTYIVRVEQNGAFITEKIVIQ